MEQSSLFSIRQHGNELEVDFYKMPVQSDDAEPDVVHELELCLSYVKSLFQESADGELTYEYSYEYPLSCVDEALALYLLGKGPWDALLEESFT